jgi:hypothetical protein
MVTLHVPMASDGQKLIIRLAHDTLAESIKAMEYVLQWMIFIDAAGS